MQAGSPPPVDLDQAALQEKFLGIDTAGLCDDVENIIGDIMCDGLDELESVLSAEETVVLDESCIRQVRTKQVLTAGGRRAGYTNRFWRFFKWRWQGVDQVMYKFQKNTIANCRVFKRYSMQQVFTVSPELAERMHRSNIAEDPPAAPRATEEEQALDTDLVRCRQQAHSVRPAPLRLSPFTALAALQCA